MASRVSGLGSAERKGSDMFFETLLQDLRIGLRVLFKEKSFCVLAVSVLAMGICAVTTQYAVVNGVLSGAPGC